MCLHIIQGARDEGKTSALVDLGNKRVLVLRCLAFGAFDFNSQKAPVGQNAQNVANTLLTV
jgi:hypothetical protein